MSRRRSVIGAVAVLVVALTAVGIAAAVNGHRGNPSDAQSSGPSDVPAVGSNQVKQAPALPGAQPISTYDRVYTADQTSNTVSVINPATNKVLGTMPMGQLRFGQALGPIDIHQVNVHGLGFSRDGRHLAVVSVQSNAVQVVDTATDRVISTTYVGRSPHEAFISPDGSEVWTAIRGQNYVSVVDIGRGVETRRIATSPGPSKVVFSPDGRTAYVNHLRSAVLDVIDVGTKRVTDSVKLPLAGSSDFAVSPDNREVWLGHPFIGKTTVVDVQEMKVKAVLNSGPRTNHPNFVTTADGAYAWVAVGGLDEVKVYRRGNGAPVLVDTIHTSGHDPHGVWPSPDNSRVYVSLQKSDAVEVFDAESRSSIARLRVGQDPQALVYVARTTPSPSSGLSMQGLDRRVKTYPLVTTAPNAVGEATVRDVSGIDQIDVAARGLAPNAKYDVYALSGDARTKLLTFRSDDTGAIDDALAFVEFFDNAYRGVTLAPAARAATVTAHGSNCGSSGVRTVASRSAPSIGTTLVPTLDAVLTRWPDRAPPARSSGAMWSAICLATSSCCC